MASPLAWSAGYSHSSPYAHRQVGQHFWNVPIDATAVAPAQREALLLALWAL